MTSKLISLVALEATLIISLRNAPKTFSDWIQGLL